MYPSGVHRSISGVIESSDIGRMGVRIVKETIVRRVMRQGVFVNGTIYWSEQLVFHQGEIITLESPVREGDSLVGRIGQTKVELRPLTRN